MPTQRPNPEHPAPSAGRERRRWARANADIPATIVLEVVLDLGVEGGVRKIRGQGAVVRCERIAKGVEHWEIAVFLHEMAERDREAIERFVAGRPTASSQA